MSDLIQATVVGRLTRDAELRQAGSGQVCGFRLAATPYKSEAMFFDVSIWGKRGEALQQYLTKGQQVVVVGNLSERSYEHNGEQRTSKEINASEVSLVGARGERSGSGGTDTPAESSDESGTDLPF
jgi:single-strand DNA-binding protein